MNQARDILLVDAGNTHVKLSFVRSNRGLKDIQTDDLTVLRLDSTAPDRLTQLARHMGPPVKEVWLCSVLGEPFEHGVQQSCDHAGVTLRVLQVLDTPDLKTRYATPRQLGRDRWSLMLAAVQQAQQRMQRRPLLCVSLGTATTVDAVVPGSDPSDPWLHLGGYITPGLHTMLDSVHSKTAQLPRVPLAQADWPVDTASAIGAGVYQMQVDFIQTRLHQLQDFTGQPACCVLSGGGAQALAGALVDAWVLPQAVLLGLCVAFMDLSS
ncbi:type III pantothenate kinase [Limnobacter humi]|uniref:Type III pantothenate kinase n=1 Tax=Limnobacter humi TaxID=1778671 RepID=A0ABT1WCZ9_9BURK|nr:type III pantothenate kinase [Limnobacter humi]MCQ8895391.1 type III pantothenate kinase [Limnobacter humi]